MSSKIEVCKTCNGTGVEYDGAGHTCTACNGIAAPVVERQPVGFYDGSSLPDIRQRHEQYGQAEFRVQTVKFGAFSSPLYTAPPELAELQATIAQLQAQLQPRTVRDVVSFAYIEEMSTRHISDLLTKQHDEITMLRNVVKEVAEQFDGGPDHPWIPGFNAKKIYNKVMMASVPLRSAQSDDSPE